MPSAIFEFRFKPNLAIVTNRTVTAVQNNLTIISDTKRTAAVAGASSPAVRSPEGLGEARIRERSTGAEG